MSLLIVQLSARSGIGLSFLSSFTRPATVSRNTAPEAVSEVIMLFISAGSCCKLIVIISGSDVPANLLALKSPADTLGAFPEPDDVPLDVLPGAHAESKMHAVSARLAAPANFRCFINKHSLSHFYLQFHQVK